jgi:putative addiction module component (TIGR02574 family)
MPRPGTSRADSSPRRSSEAKETQRSSNTLSARVRHVKIVAMIKEARAVLADALRLDSAARAELAAELLASLDGPGDPDAEAAWNDEIDRRVEAIEAGTVRLEPWEQVKRRIEKDLLGREAVSTERSGQR